MKNQYFGDFGDYQKFSLLKTLRGIGGFKIVVHWMKTADDSGMDGKRIGYLNKPELWNAFDKEIFNFIKKHIDKKKRDLTLYEKSSHAIGIEFVSDRVEDSQRRAKLLDRIRNDKKSDLVFFDPDNGIEVKSTNLQNVHKYVLWTEICTVFNLGKSILIYQHFSHKNRNDFIQEKIKEFEDRFDAGVFVVRVKHSVYFLLAQKSHAQKVRRSLDHYSRTWGVLVSVSDPCA